MAFTEIKSGPETELQADSIAAVIAKIEAKTVLFTFISFSSIIGQKLSDVSTSNRSYALFFDLKNNHSSPPIF
ncbi:hypothetical protein HMPREF9444_00676 [Succinatimonas hippei YIT 12066]|uniref:Uncharacterized protein n=1 Tax=Succinatimonas hippei (strain DSM 22608 / JCM 16073 / KCTC 15190 / YIT 12066) TaxID=762983 RepID=E8LJ02_SUCHY|nr:hypothetical protein HMPREF9444_00676 [Succinatimonas hippei YIT 12066]